MTAPVSRRWDHETMLLVWLAACVSLVSFFFYLRHGELLLYGDAVAHINIARRVFDSRTPGLLQLGTVWLPLPHLLMIPFLLSTWMWQSGIGGSIPSLIAYVLGTVGIYRLVRGWLRSAAQSEAGASVAGWLAALVYAANPNLMYLQATAMTEALYLALFIWAVVYFSEFIQSAAQDKGTVYSSLMKCAMCLAGASLTRYDGWFLAVVTCGALVLFVVLAAHGDKTLRRTTVKVVLLAATAPVLWLAYNAAIYRNPLEFANGPYSAQAIDQKISVPGTSPHPGAGNLHVAASYFLKAAEINLIESSWHRLWLGLLLLGTACVLIIDRRLWPLLLLWAPLPFYALSISYGGVPIYLSAWPPFSLYNVRYGLELLPAFAVFVVLLAYQATRFIRSRKGKAVVVGTLLILVVGSYASVWRAEPVCFREAWINSRTRIALERELADTLKRLPPHSTILMYLGDHAGAVQDAGIPLRRVIYEGNHRTWKQPSDLEGLWERALADPRRYAEFVVAFDGDPVSAAVQKQDLTPLAVIRVAGQPRAVIYQTHSLTPESSGQRSPRGSSG